MLIPFGAGRKRASIAQNVAPMLDKLRFIVKRLVRRQFTSNRRHDGHLSRGRARVLSGQETATTMLSVAAHMGQAKVHKSKPGLSCSRSERIIGASQSGQNGRSSVALPWKNEGTERLSIDASLDQAGARHSQSPIDAGVRGGDRSIMRFGFVIWRSVLLTFKNLTASSSAKSFSGSQGF
jgi:hypothetical protein